MQQVLEVARNALGAVCVIGPERRIEYCSRDAALALGRSEEELTGRPCNEVFSTAGEVCRVSGAIERALGGEPAEPVEVDLAGQAITVVPLAVQKQDFSVVLSLFPRRPVRRAKKIAGPLGNPPLTPREHEVLHCLVEGWDTERIAQSMGISRTTVRNHVQRVLRKLGAHSKLEAVAIATRLGGRRRR